MTNLDIFVKHYTSKNGREKITVKYKNRVVAIITLYPHLTGSWDINLTPTKAVEFSVRGEGKEAKYYIAELPKVGVVYDFYREAEARQILSFERVLK